MLGGERIVRNDDGQACAVDKALNDAPLAVNQREEVSTAVQEDESATRAQALLREHAGHAFIARRRETRSHTFGHGVLQWGTRRHVARGFLSVQRGRRKPLASVNKTHLEGHGASFISMNQSARTGTRPSANRYQDTRESGSLLAATRVQHHRRWISSESTAPKSKASALLAEDRGARLHQDLTRADRPISGCSFKCRTRVFGSTEIVELACG